MTYLWAFAWWYLYCIGRFSGTVLDENHGYHTWAKNWTPGRGWS